MLAEKLKDNSLGCCQSPIFQKCIVVNFVNFERSVNFVNFFNSVNFRKN